MGPGRHADAAVAYWQAVQESNPLGLALEAILRPALPPENAKSPGNFSRPGFFWGHCAPLREIIEQNKAVYKHLPLDSLAPQDHSHSQLRRRIRCRLMRPSPWISPYLRPHPVAHLDHDRQSVVSVQFVYR